MDTAAKLLSVLQLYTAEKSEWTVEEAAQELGVSISTAYRYFRSLCKAGLLDPLKSNAYILGPAITEYDRLKRVNDPLIRVGQPIIQRLLSRADNPGIALLCRIYRHCVMCVHQEGEQSAREPISYERGRPMPMFHGASSKIIFANLPSRSVLWFFRKYPDAIAEAGLGSDWETLKTNLRRIRQDRVMVATGEVDPGHVGIAAPIFDADRKVIGSVSIVMMESDSTPERIANISALVDAAGREIHVAFLGLHAHRAPQAPDIDSDQNDAPDVADNITGSGLGIDTGR